MSTSVALRVIGHVRSQFASPQNMPIQPVDVGPLQSIELDPDFGPALCDLEGFERIWVLFHCHLSRDWQALVQPFLCSQPKGVFATRAPSRPSPIGLSNVALHRVDTTRSRIEVTGLDAVDGTPVLDIKPYVPSFDSHPESVAGWLESAEPHGVRSDGRFVR